MSRAPRPGEVADVDGVKIVGYTNVPAGSRRRPPSLYARNLFAFIETLFDKKTKALAVNWDDELVKATALTKDGAVIHPNFQPKSLRREAMEHIAAGRRSLRLPAVDFRARDLRRLFRGVVGDAGAAYAADERDQRDLLGDRGRRAARGRRRHDLRAARGWARGFGFVALIFACVNIFGGFLVTQRMLAMYKKKAEVSGVTRGDEEWGPEMNANLAAVLYLVAGVLFILALRGLSSPASSRQGNLFGMIGMAIAIVTTLASHPPADGIAWMLIILGIAIGGGIGAVIARRVPMTSMPELVAAFHSLVGMAAVLVAAGAFYAPEAFGIGTPGNIHAAEPDRNVARRRHRRADLHRLGDRVPEAVGAA